MPPLTNSERQKRYREKKKLENNEEFLLKNRLKAKEYYEKLKNNKIIISDEKDKPFELVKLEPIDKRINPINKSILLEDTIIHYFNIMKNIYKKYNKKDLEDDNDLNNVLRNLPYNYKKLNNEFDFLRKDLFNVIKDNYNYINVIYSVITRFKYFDKTVKELYPYIQIKQESYDNKRINEKPDINVMNKITKLSFNKEDIINNINNPDFNLTPFEKLIYGLFTLFPTRRAIDYRRMIITDKEPINDFSYNYYYDKKFYFFLTKNKKIQVFDVPDELDNLIIKNSYFLLGKQYPESSLSKEIMKIFKKIYGIAISAVEVRRLFATYFNKKCPDYLLRLDITNKMNHKVEENMKYAYF